MGSSQMGGASSIEGYVQVLWLTDFPRSLAKGDRSPMNIEKSERLY